MPAMDGRGDRDVASTQAAAAQAAAASQAAALGYQQAAPGVVADLNANNFTKAWSDAEAAGTGTNGGSVTSNPLLGALETSSGLKALDPSKDWTPSEMTAYYDAAMAGGNWNSNLLGKDPYGATLWGSNAPGKASADAATNESTQGDNTAPDVARFAGAQPTKNFIEKYGADIALAVAAIAAPYAVPALAAAAGVGAGAGALVGAGAVYGAGTSAAIAGATGGNVGKAAELGAIGGAVGGAELGGAGSAANEASSALGNATGLGSIASHAVVQGGIGALGGAASGAITGKGALAGAEFGAIGGAVGGAIQGSGLSGAGAAAAKVGGNLAVGAAGSALSSSSSSSGASPVADATTAASSDSGFLGGLTSGLGSSLGVGTGGSLSNSLGTLTGQLAPYAAIAGVGEAQAKAGQAADAKFSQQQQNLAQPAITESNSLLGQFNSGTLSATDQTLVNTGEQQGQSTIDSAAQLSTIAQTAFSNYNSGTLKAADQTQLDQQTAAQKQQVAQQLASAGITDSTILAAQNQQIDNNALIQKQTILNGYFSTGNQAYDTWLSATTQGQQTIQAAQKFASTELQQTLTNSMQEASIGIGEMNTAISTQMQTDEKYADAVSTLMGNLAQAYAKQYAQGASTTINNGGAANGGGARTATNSAGAAGSALGAAGSTATGALGTGTGLDTSGYGGTADQGLTTGGNIDPTLSGDIAGLTAGANNDATNDLLGNIQDTAGNDSSIWGDLAIGA